VKLLENATDADVQQALDIFTNLMEHDAAAKAIAGGEVDLIPAFAESMIKAIAFAGGHMYVARNEKGDIVGFALWIPPGHDLFNTPEQCELGFDDFMGRLSDAGKRYYAETLGSEFPKFINRSVGISDAGGNCYWCHMAMVRKDYQRQGICRALFRLADEEASKTGSTVAFTTTDEINVTIYTKLGYQVKGHTVMKSPWGDWEAWSFRKDTKHPVS